MTGLLSAQTQNRTRTCTADRTPVGWQGETSVLESQHVWLKEMSGLPAGDPGSGAGPLPPFSDRVAL